VQNADGLHPAWSHPRVGEVLKLHPTSPAPRIVAAEPDHLLLAHLVQPSGGTEESQAPAEGVAISWLFLLEPIDDGRCRLTCRYRCAAGGHLVERLAYGATLIEPIGFR
jgi:hypothetical protein